MVAQFLGLKLRLLAGAFRRSPWQIVGMVFAIFYGLLVTAVVVAALVGARFVGDVAQVRDVIVVIGSCVVLGFLLLPLLFGVDDALDPRAFSLYGIRNTRLATGLALAAFISVPSLALTVCALASIVTWSRGPGMALLAVISAIIAVPTCVLGSRVTTSVAAFLLATRRSRELSGLLAVLAILLLSLLGIVVLNIHWVSSADSVVRSAERWLSWTPLGAVWAIPGDAALGQWGSAALKLLIALAFLGVLWISWVVLVAKMLVTPERTSRARDYAGLGWFGRLRRGSARAIAARTITYWARDPRYWVALVVIPVFPALMVIALLVAGVPAHYVSLLPLPIMCLFLGWTIHNDVAYDGTAVWLHIVSGAHGAADRAGRTFPVLLIGIPLIAIGSVVTTVLYGQWSVLPAVIGLSLAVLLIGVGLSSIASALFPYPTTKPGDSAFTHPQSAGGTAALIQLFSFIAIVVLASPAIVFFVLGLFVSSVWLIGVPVFGVAIGVVALIFGIRLGGRIFDERGPELMSFATSNG
jgi:ABC-2 type transport system permease protein